ncbi:MAG: hypothetical protein FJ008_06630 [Chloroflexi bacterium]|nr:hypothetical protein [Chloroflexota bacterium]MBM3154996.1 hypothetical protein [Chloroflexota bacterium]MBM3172918.1 hypothetical protein [Chloroflexota bacterium]MBM3175248.1 hypothetical protein [Chloroflexota bacterium]MBM4451208.1 hypothetical protein [Chloroflexota bacterium]
MGDIRSAWEIANEKADKLGGLSQEEKRKQKEERCNQIGKALADKYLERENARYLETELKKYDEQDKESIARATLKRLTDAIDFRYAQALDKIKDGIFVLSKNSVKGVISQVEELFREYQQAEDSKRQEIEKAGREILHQMRVSGTAIGKVNIEANAQWQKDLAQISQPFEEKLRSLKQELLSI